VVIFHNFVSGEDDEYMSAFEKFIQYSTSKNAKFVKTSENDLNRDGYGDEPYVIYGRRGAISKDSNPLMIAPY
ncbi:MAG: hypothetical protein ACXQT4_04750, partial [Methanotrichaceae archaeon]